MKLIGLSALLITAVGCNIGGEPGYPDCDVQDAAALQELATVGALDCNVTLVDSAFVDLAALEGVRSVPYSVTLRDNAALADATALSTLEDWHLVQITGNDVLSTVAIGGGDGFEDLLVSDDGIQELELPDATTGRNLMIKDVTRFSSLEAPRLTSVDRLILSRTALRDFSGLAELVSVSTSAVIRENPELDSAEIDAFLAQLRAAPESVTTCSNLDDSPCP